MIPEPDVERVVPSYTSPEPTTSVPTCEVPFPFKIPVSVVEPVPPLATPRAEARVSAPVEENEEVAV